MYETTYETKLKEMNNFLLLLVDRKPSPDELIRFCANLIEIRRMDRDRIEFLQDKLIDSLN